MTVVPKFLATGIGSMPFDDADQAVEVSLSRLTQAPLWPQLPKRGLNEQMEVQYAQGMPCVVVDRDEGRAYFDTSGDYSELFGEFYETYVEAMDPDEGSGDCSSMAIPEDYAAGLYALERRLKNQDGKLPFVKVQTTGPCTVALSITDENKRAIYYNEEFRDVVVKSLAMQSRWQIQKFRPYAEQVICFIDEPILAGFGSSTYVSVHREDVVAHINELVEAIHADNALAGIHCCGNTEWAVPIDSGADIVNFDAFEFGETIAMYPDSVKSLFARGGYLAWGVVPTSVAIREQTVEDLEKTLEEGMDRLASTGMEKGEIVDRAILTPSCGTGSMQPDDARRVFQLTQALSRRMREKYA
ncbi:MAG: hypothetical protein ACQESR_07145 [Planctomycetota bacterium]